MKIIIGKISALIIIVLLLQIALDPFFNTLNTSVEIKELNKYLANKVDVIYLGDSTIDYTAKKDLNTKSIATMLQDLVARLKIYDISKGAFNMDVYWSYCRYIVMQKYHPKLIIIPINMSTFSPQCDKRPEYQYGKLRVDLSDNNLLKILYKTLSVFKYNLYGITQKEFENTTVYYGDMPIGKVKNFDWTIRKNYFGYASEVARKWLVYAYMYALKEQHRKLQSMVNIARITKQNNIKVIFYLTPIDYEAGERYWPGLFLERLESNTKLIVSMLSKEGVDVLDLSKDLKTELFDYTFPIICEHMNETGRSYVAQKLADKIKTLQIVSAP